MTAVLTVPGDMPLTSNAPEEVTMAPTPLEPVTMACTRPEDAFTTGMLKPGALDHGLVAAVAVTVGTLDRLNTVESVTGIVPPDVATITNGALLSVTVPLLSEGMLLSTTVQLLDAIAVTSWPPEVVTGPTAEEVPMMLTPGVLLKVTIPLVREPI